MQLGKLLDKQRWLNRWSDAKKRLKRAGRGRAHSTPVFIFGKQRSGTTMLMQALNLHPDTELYNEGRDTPAFLKGRIRSFEVVHRLITESRARFVCFKPLSDSHLISRFRTEFPDGRFVWLHRGYRDTAASSLVKFPGATEAIRRICTRREGGGWLQEGVSPGTQQILERVYTPELTDLDLACLVWWLRNRVLVEDDLIGRQNLYLCRYEEITRDPPGELRRLFEYIGLPWDDRVCRNVHPKSNVKARTAPLHPSIARLCDELTDRLVNAKGTIWTSDCSRARFSRTGLPAFEPPE